ncbi:hypothetical protein ACRYCC_10145 [Actinomadura scrupuli]|uniref:hypothetical protein n=1 Tax=Actinomadura scrupuli TaxID=559629 RepID=UPI003D99B7A3
MRSADARPAGGHPYSPAFCPGGHRLTAGRVDVGWLPCQCGPALAGRRGHTTRRCRACQDDGWTTLAFTPEHLRTAADLEYELSSMHDALPRARQGLDAHPDPGPARERAAAYLSALTRGIAEKEAIAAVRHLRPGRGTPSGR